MNPVQYAETQLGVHTVYAEAQSEYAAYVAAADRLEDAEQAIRHTAAMHDDRQAVLVAEHGPATAALTTQAARKAHMQSVFDADPEIKDLEDRLSTLNADKRLAQRDMSVNKMGLELRIARMQELGGLLQFYAVAKAAQPEVRHVGATPQVDESQGASA